jgi:hypothetical protein
VKWICTTLCGCAALGAVAADASAAGTVTVDRLCYSKGDGIVETGTGFTPGAPITESLTLTVPPAPDVLGQLFTLPVVADAAGNFQRGLNTPDLARPTDRRDIATATFTDTLSAEPPTATQWTLSDWDFSAAPLGRITARTKFALETWGWTTAGEKLYIHHFRGGVRVASAEVGALAQPCGDLAATLNLFPPRARPGRWRIYLSATPALDRKNDAWFGFRVRLKKRRGAARTSAAAPVIERHAGASGKR